MAAQSRRSGRRAATGRAPACHEYVFFLPGFLWFTKRAIGSDPPNYTLADINTLAGIAVWSAVLVAVLSLTADVVTAALDPRVGARSR